MAQQESAHDVMFFLIKLMVFFLTIILIQLFFLKSTNFEIKNAQQSQTYTTVATAAEKRPWMLL